MEFEKQHYSLSLKQTLKTIYTSCCNSSCNNDEDDFQKFPEHSQKKRRSCCKWLKSEISKLFSCKPCRNCRRKSSSSSVFKYDPLSYSLNFEDGDDSHLDEFPLRDFCSRLPPSPVKETDNNIVVSISYWS